MNNQTQTIETTPDDKQQTAAMPQTTQEHGDH
jgi:hypothetical protein